jgi:hypothetical protein
VDPILKVMKDVKQIGAFNLRKCWKAYERIYNLVKHIESSEETYDNCITKDKAFMVKFYLTTKGSLPPWSWRLSFLYQYCPFKFLVDSIWFRI